MKKNFLSILVLSAASLLILGACGEVASTSGTPSSDPTTETPTTATPTTAKPTTQTPTSIIPSQFANTIDEVKGFVERGLQTSVNSLIYNYEYTSSGKLNRTTQTYNLYENAMVITSKILNPYQSTPENEVYRENTSEYRTTKNGRYYSVLEDLNDLMSDPQLTGNRIVADEASDYNYALDKKQSEVDALLTSIKTGNYTDFGLGASLPEVFAFPLNVEGAEYKVESKVAGEGFTSTVSYAIEGEYNSFNGTQNADFYDVTYTFDAKFDLVNVAFARETYNQAGYDFENHEIVGEPIYPYDYNYVVGHGAIAPETSPKYNISDIACTDFEVKVYADEACTEEVSPLELKTQTDYFVDIVTNPADAYDVIIVSEDEYPFSAGRPVDRISYYENGEFDVKFMSATGVEKSFSFKFTAPKVESLYIDDTYATKEISVGDTIYLPYVEAYPEAADGSYEIVVTEGEDVVSVEEEYGDWKLTGIKAGTAKYKAVSTVDPTVESNEVTITVKEPLPPEVVIAAVTADTWYGSHYGAPCSITLNEDGTALVDFGVETVWGPEGRYQTEKSTTLSFNWAYDGKFTCSNAVWSYSDDENSNFIGFLFEGLSISGDASVLSLNLNQGGYYQMSVEFRPPLGFAKAFEGLLASPWSAYSMDLGIEIYIEFNADGSGVIGAMKMDSNWEYYLYAPVTFTWTSEGESVKITSFAAETMKYQVSEWDEVEEKDVYIEKELALAACDVELDTVMGETVDITLGETKLSFMSYYQDLSE